MITIRDMLDQGIEIEGTVKIQYYDYKQNKIEILYENEANDWDEEDEFFRYGSYRYVPLYASFMWS